MALRQASRHHGGSAALHGADVRAREAEAAGRGVVRAEAQGRGVGRHAGGPATAGTGAQAQKADGRVGRVAGVRDAVAVRQPDARAGARRALRAGAGTGGRVGGADGRVDQAQRAARGRALALAQLRADGGGAAQADAGGVVRRAAGGRRRRSGRAAQQAGVRGCGRATRVGAELVRAKRAQGGIRCRRAAHLRRRGGAGHLRRSDAGGGKDGQGDEGFLHDGS
jgi:hypothetical protein